MWGLGVSKWRLAGTPAVLAASRPACTGPPTPAAASRWPRLVLTEPTTQRLVRRCGRRRDRRRGPAPRSDRRGRCRCRGPRRSRRRRRDAGVGQRGADDRLLGGPFGAVRPLLAPSWLTAEPRITARIRSPSASRVGQALEHDDAAALGAHEAVGRGVAELAAAVGRHHLVLRQRDGHLRASIRLTPPASARLHSPARRLCTARCTATSDDEQAVSSEMLGPCRPRM